MVQDEYENKDEASIHDAYTDADDRLLNPTAYLQNLRTLGSKVFQNSAVGHYKSPVEAAFSAREPSPRNEVEEQDSIAGL